MAGGRSRKLPDASVFGPMRHRFGVRLSFAGTAFLNCYAEALEPLLLTPSRVLALAFVNEHPGADQASLGRAMKINRASAMELVDKLEGCGLLRRSPGADKRGYALHLTHQGVSSFREALDLELQLHNELFGWMTEAEQQSFLAVVDEVVRRAVARSEMSLPDPLRSLSG